MILALLRGFAPPLAPVKWEQEHHFPRRFWANPVLINQSQPLQPPMKQWEGRRERAQPSSHGEKAKRGWEPVVLLELEAIAKRVFCFLRFFRAFQRKPCPPRAVLQQASCSAPISIPGTSTTLPSTRLFSLETWPWSVMGSFMRRKSTSRNLQKTDF